MLCAVGPRGAVLSTHSRCDGCCQLQHAGSVRLVAADVCLIGVTGMVCNSTHNVNKACSMLGRLSLAVVLTGPTVGQSLTWQLSTNSCFTTNLLPGFSQGSSYDGLKHDEYDNTRLSVVIDLGR